MSRAYAVSKTKKKKKKSSFEIITGTIFLLLCALCLVPIFYVFALSFSGKSAILSGKVGLWPVDFTLSAYEQIFENTGFIHSFGFSVFLTALYTFISMTVTILAAYPLSREGLKGKGIITLMLVITMYFDPGMIPNYLNVKNLHLLDSFWALIVPSMMSVYNLIILRTFFSSIDKALYEAATIDGASELQILVRIILPLSAPAIATLSLFYAVTRWNSVQDVILYVSDSSLYTVQMKLKQMLDNINVPIQEQVDVNFELLPENMKAAAIIFSMIPMVVIYPFIQKYFVGGIMMGSVKG